MAVIEKSGLMKYKDKSGNLYLMLPITNMDNVDGLDEALAGKENSGAAAQALTDAKAYTDEQIAAIPTPDVSAQLANAQKLDLPITGSSTNGVDYTATVDGITSLTAGFSFIMVPNYTSTSTTAKLNVNGLGAKNLRLRAGGSTTTTVAPSSSNWLTSGKPVRVTYDGLWWVCDLTPAIESPITYSTTDLTAGSSSLATGKLYVVYE